MPDGLAVRIEGGTEPRAVEDRSRSERLDALDPPHFRRKLARPSSNGLTGGGNELALSWHSIRNRLDPSAIGAGASNLGLRHRWCWWLSHRRPYLRVPGSRCRAMPRYLSTCLRRSAMAGVPRD